MLGFIMVLVVSSMFCGYVSTAQAAQGLSSAPASFSQLVKDSRSSVVNISTVKIIKAAGGPRMPFGGGSPFGSNDPYSEFFERFFGNRIPREYRQKSLGSGFIIDKDGFILTNNHVVEKSDKITVKLSDGEKEYEARIIGRDPKTDLALIRIDPEKPLKPLFLGNSDKLEVGDWVIAIGNPFALGNTVTAGIVSAKYRHIGAGAYDNFIQTDASINPGNSGGPLLNTKGEVIGINTAIFSRTGGSIGIGFAIPVNMAKALLPQLKKGEIIRGWLGVMIQEVTPILKKKLELTDSGGALVGDVAPGSPADKAGLKRGDVIVSFDGKVIRDINDLPLIVAATPVGKKVKVEVIRKGRKKVLSVKVARLEDEEERDAGSETRTDLGMTVQAITPFLAQQLGLSDTSGIVVVHVKPYSSSAEAGLKQGDIIMEIDQERAKSMADFYKKISRYKKGDTILLLTKRGNNTLYLTIKIPE
jgi:serine protease Do